MKIEVGGQYETVSGEEVRIYATDANGLYPIHGAVLRDGKWTQASWMITGIFAEKEIGMHEYDLVEKKKKIKYDFWVVLDQEGKPITYVREEGDAKVYAGINPVVHVKGEIEK